MPKVFVVNNGGHDYTEAMAFGELVFCTKGSLDRNDTAQMFRELTDALEDARMDDYLLITSLASLCCIATGILADRWGRVNFLLFDGKHYIAKSVMFDSWYTEETLNHER